MPLNLTVPGEELVDELCRELVELVEDKIGGKDELDGNAEEGLNWPLLPPPPPPHALSSKTASATSKELIKLSSHFGKISGITGLKKII